MIVKSGKSAACRVVFGTAIMDVLFVYMKYHFDASWFPFLLIICIVTLGSLRYWISFGRTLTFSEKGCTVQLWCFSKFYTWDELSLKRYQDFSHVKNRVKPYKRGAVFSPCAVYGKRWSKFLDPFAYCFYIHPVSFFYVYFTPKEVSENQAKRLYQTGYYTVDETEFRTALTNWNVKMDDLV